MFARIAEFILIHRQSAISLMLVLTFCFQTGCGKNHEKNILDTYQIRIGTNTFTFKQQMLFVFLSLEMYRVHVGAYPNARNGLDALIHQPEIMEATGTWRGPYAVDAAVFYDPWGRRLSYRLDDGGKADLRSLGRDGIPGEDDIIAKDLFPDIYRELEKLPMANF